MKIGIDIDGVILNSENEFRVNGEIYDLLELHKNGVVNTKGIIDIERYDWTTEEKDGFRQKYLLRSLLDAQIMPGAQRILKLLKDDGHELILITARGMKEHCGEDAKKAAIDKFEKYGLKFDKYYWATKDKVEVAKQENIDVMIDDRITICSQMQKNKIKTLYFRDVNREKLEENEYLKEVNNWGEIYRYIYNLNLEEK